ncbi:hypothetical protein JCM10908_006009 [Rhodotorula pacifica]|uniref:uncharacterized protein n=1 Tax=Rhodotorula pacifica TaxID=1495444 RepID=UPI003182A395
MLTPDRLQLISDAIVASIRFLDMVLEEVSNPVAANRSALFLLMHALHRNQLDNPLVDPEPTSDAAAYRHRVNERCVVIGKKLQELYSSCCGSDGQPTVNLSRAVLGRPHFRRLPGGAAELPDRIEPDPTAASELLGEVADVLVRGDLGAKASLSRRDVFEITSEKGLERLLVPSSLGGLNGPIGRAAISELDGNKMSDPLPLELSLFEATVIEPLVAYLNQLSKPRTLRAKPLRLQRQKIHFEESLGRLFGLQRRRGSDEATTSGLVTTQWSVPSAVSHLARDLYCSLWADRYESIAAMVWLSEANRPTGVDGTDEEETRPAAADAAVIGRGRLVAFSSADARACFGPAGRDYPLDDISDDVGITIWRVPGFSRLAVALRRFYNIHDETHTKARDIVFSRAAHADMSEGVVLPPHQDLDVTAGVAVLRATVRRGATVAAAIESVRAAARRSLVRSEPPDGGESSSHAGQPSAGPSSGPASAGSEGSLSRTEALPNRVSPAVAALRGRAASDTVELAQDSAAAALSTASLADLASSFEATMFCEQTALAAQWAMPFFVVLLRQLAPRLTALALKARTTTFALVVNRKERERLLDDVFELPPPVLSLSLKAFGNADDSDEDVEGTLPAPAEIRALSAPILSRLCDLARGGESLSPSEQGWRTHFQELGTHITTHGGPPCGLPQDWGEEREMQVRLERWSAGEVSASGVMRDARHRKEARRQADDFYGDDNGRGQDEDSGSEEEEVA